MKFTVYLVTNYVKFPETGDGNYFFTVQEVQSIRPFARRSVNSVKVLQWWSMRKYFEA